MQALERISRVLQSISLRILLPLTFHFRWKICPTNQKGFWLEFQIASTLSGVTGLMYAPASGYGREGISLPSKNELHRQFSKFKFAKRTSERCENSFTQATTVVLTLLGSHLLTCLSLANFILILD
jgi:hypothetical protein